METGTLIVIIAIGALCLFFGGGNVFKDRHGEAGGRRGGNSSTSSSNSDNTNGGV